MDSKNYEVPYLSSSEIRQSFIDFFKNKEHRVYKSAGLVPHDDPTILFTNSGMNQFKSIFLGDHREGLKRVVDSQKCLRVSGKHNDLDEVGQNGRHHTFFEMLGSWSFGDYFKKEAILWAWELLTEVWKLPKDRLFATVYIDDDEAFQIWSEHTDIDPSHILRFKEDNFWEMGPTGPCGPSSEIVFDMGDLTTQKDFYLDPVYGVNGKDDRFLEIWNLVFIQQERMKDGSLKKLSQKHIDTGAGLERLCAVIQRKKTNYQTDVFMTLIQEIEKLSQVPYKEGNEGLPHRVLADHIRAVSFAIADGASPGNEGRAYVIRRILRRASRFANQLGQKEAFLYKLVPSLVRQMGDQYPELVQQKNYIMEVIQSEEKRFLQTLEQGLGLLKKLTEQLKKKKERTIPGKDVFTLYDTFGFPIDLTRIVAEDEGFSIDEKGYHECMEEQKERARQHAKFDNALGNDESWVILDSNRDTEFLGYKTLSAEVQTSRYREDKDIVYICLDKTPFYAEAGGQIGDVGILSNPEVELKVIDTFKAFEMHIHRCHLQKGLLKKENISKLTAQVDEKARLATAQHHSVTHLLHAALRTLLGDHVVQQGSYVGPDRLRFDFSFSRKLTDEELQNIEILVNEEIQRNSPVLTEVKSFDEAKKEGVLAFFGDKYGDKVRVLSMGTFSKELCGGTHAKATGDIGLFKIVSESSVAAGVRRIEALAGLPAFKKLQEESNILNKMTLFLKTPTSEIGEKVQDFQKRIKSLEKEKQEFKNKELQEKVLGLYKQRSNPSYIVKSLSSEIDSSQFANFANALQGLLKKEAAVLSHSNGSSMSLMVLVAKDLLAKVKAPELMKELSKLCNGRGGGRPERAQGGSTETDKESLVLSTAEDLLKKALG